VGSGDESPLTNENNLRPIGSECQVRVRPVRVRPVMSLLEMLLLFLSGLFTVDHSQPPCRIPDDLNAVVV
jgi:hypothetical protein